LIFGLWIVGLRYWSAGEYRQLLIGGHIKVLLALNLKASAVLAKIKSYEKDFSHHKQASILL
jgi:hypothetical protein